MVSRPSKRRPPAGRAPGPSRGGIPGLLRLNAPPSAGSSRGLRAAAAAVAALAGGVLAWIAFAHHPVGDYFTESDFYGYAWGARMIQRGVIDFSRYSVVGPLYELLLAALSLVVRDAFRAGELISIASAVGVILLWTRIVRRRAGEGAALWTALFIAANPVFLRYGYSATTDMLAVLLQSAAATALLGATGRRAPLAAGALAALAALTRYSALALVPAAAACYLLWPVPAGGSDAGAGTAGQGEAAGGGARPRLAALARFAAGFGLLAIPWLACSLATGHAPGSNLIQSFSYYVDPSQGRNIQDVAPGAAAGGYQSLGLLLRDRPGALLARLLGNVPEHFTRNLRTLVGVPVAWVCGAGLVFALLDGSWRSMLPVTLVGAIVFASLVPVFYSDRYALPLLPYYLVFAGLAAGSRLLALRLTPPGAHRLPSFALKWGLALVPLVLSIRSSVTQQRWVESQLPVEVRAAGEALRRVAPPGSGVLSRKMHLWYYSGARPVAFPRVARLAALADACRGNGAQYLYFSWYEAELRPEFWYLLDSTATVPGLTRIPFPTPHPALLYAIGPDFGRDPAWLASDSVRSLHVARAQVRVLNEHDAWGAHFTLGEEARARGDRAAALAHYLAAARGNPGLALAWQRAGDELLGLGRYDEAREAYERVRRLVPGDVASQIGIGWTQLRMGRPDLAAKTWWPLVGKTRDEATLRAMAEVFERVGDVESLEGARRALADLPARK